MNQIWCKVHLKEARIRCLMGNLFVIIWPQLKNNSFINFSLRIKSMKVLKEKLNKKFISTKISSVSTAIKQKIIKCVKTTQNIMKILKYLKWLNLSYLLKYLPKSKKSKIIIQVFLLIHALKLTFLNEIIKIYFQNYKKKFKKILNFNPKF